MCTILYPLNILCIDNATTFRTLVPRYANVSDQQSWTGVYESKVYNLDFDMLLVRIVEGGHVPSSAFLSTAPCRWKSVTTHSVWTPLGLSNRAVLPEVFDLGRLAIVSILQTQGKVFLLVIFCQRQMDSCCSQLPAVAHGKHTFGECTRLVSISKAIRLALSMLRWEPSNSRAMSAIKQCGDWCSSNKEGAALPTTSANWIAGWFIVNECSQDAGVPFQLATNERFFRDWVENGPISRLFYLFRCVS